MKVWKRSEHHVSWFTESGIFVQIPINHTDNRVLKLRSEKKQAKQRYESEYKKARLAVLERDNHQCDVCGSDKRINVHHITERSAGGTNLPDNLVTLCYECHKEKHKTEGVYALMCKRDKRDLQNAI